MLPAAFIVPVSPRKEKAAIDGEDLECSRCGAMLTPDDVAYSGPEDRTADRNDPAQFQEIVCKQCDRKPAHYSFVREVLDDE